MTPAAAAAPVLTREPCTGRRFLNVVSADLRSRFRRSSGSFTAHSVAWFRSPPRPLLRRRSSGEAIAASLAECYCACVADNPLVVTDLRREFGAKVAVERLSFEVGPGEIVGLLGPNGAGKTTTISMVLGVLAPTSGTIVIDGVDLARHRSAALRRTNFAAVYANLPGNLTVAQNLRVFGMLYDVPALGKRIDELVELCGLRELRDQKCGLLSSGEQTRANLAKALLNTPRLLLLDEPTASLDPSIARDVREMIRRVASQTGAGVLWTSHNMFEVEGVCDRIMILTHGRVRVAGDPKTLPREHGAASLEDLFVEIARAS